MRISDWSSDVCSSDLQDERRVGMALAKGGGDREDVGGGRAFRQTAQIRGLNRRAVGHRIGEGHPKLDHIGASRDERVEIRGGVAVSRGDEGDQRGALLGECGGEAGHRRSEEHTSELLSLMRISYAVFCLKKKN